MDIFLYRVAIEQLDACRTVKGLEELVRKWYNKLDSIPLYSSTLNYLELKFTYKLFVHALNLFAAKSKKELPDFIYRMHTVLQRNLIDKLSIANTKYPSLMPLLDKLEFIDFFEFDTIVETPYDSACHITVLHNILLDTQPHFKFKFNQRLDTFDMYTTYGISNEVKFYLYAIRLKQTLSPNTPSTVIDQFLADTLAAIPKHENILEYITKLQQHIAALQTYQSTYGEACNG